MPPYRLTHPRRGIGVAPIECARIFHALAQHQPRQQLVKHIDGQRFGPGLARVEQRGQVIQRRGFGYGHQKIRPPWRIRQSGFHRLQEIAVIQARAEVCEHRVIATIPAQNRIGSFKRRREVRFADGHTIQGQLRGQRSLDSAPAWAASSAAEASSSARAFAR